MDMCHGGFCNWWRRLHLNPPTRQPNGATRAREYLAADEVERMITVARQAGGRLAERDALLIMMAYRHGFRASDLIALHWDQIDRKAGKIHIARAKRGEPSTHPVRGPELRALTAWQRQHGQTTPYIFTAQLPLLCAVRQSVP